MIRRPPRSTRTDTLLPSTTLFRSDLGAHIIVERDVGHALIGGFPGDDEGRQPLLDRTADEALLRVQIEDVEAVDPGREDHDRRREDLFRRSEEHTSELQSLMRITYAVFCFKQTNNLLYNKHQ